MSHCLARGVRGGARSPYGTKRNRLGAHGISGAEGRPAVPSTFDGDIVIATKKGVNPLERGGQVDFMADFQEMLDFSPAPKLDVLSKLDPAKTIPAEMRGQEIFFGKGQCASCHQPPYYTDNLMRNLQTERFFEPVMINNMMAVGDGPIKTFALRGTKDRASSPDGWNGAAKSEEPSRRDTRAHCYRTGRRPRNSAGSG
jgi:hypothetical protein